MQFTRWLHLAPLPEANRQFAVHDPRQSISVLIVFFSLAIIHFHT